MISRVWTGAIACAAAVGMAFAPVAAYAQQAQEQKAPRFAPIPAPRLTDSQRPGAGDDNDLTGFNGILGRNPGLLPAIEILGNEILVAPEGHKTPTPQYLGHLAMIMAARNWNNQAIWVSHMQDALNAGATQAAVDFIAQKKRLPGMKPAEAAMFDFFTELFEKRAVSDATFKTARDILGERPLVDLMATVGVYSFFSMVINVGEVQTPPPGSGVPYPQAH